MAEQADFGRGQGTVRDQMARHLPEATFQYVTVTFPLANQDVAVGHRLRTPDTNQIAYLPVKKDRACDIYNDQTAGRRVWTDKTIYLRSTVANAVVRLRLFTERAIQE